MGGPRSFFFDVLGPAKYIIREIFEELNPDALLSRKQIQEANKGLKDYIRVKGNKDKVRNRILNRIIGIVT